jgi:hypothetical protein
MCTLTEHFRDRTQDHVNCAHKQNKQNTLKTVHQKRILCTKTENFQNRITEIFTVNMNKTISPEINAINNTSHVIYRLILFDFPNIRKRTIPFNLRTVGAELFH